MGFPNETALFQLDVDDQIKVAPQLHHDGSTRLRFTKRWVWMGTLKLDLKTLELVPVYIGLKKELRPAFDEAAEHFTREIETAGGVAELARRIALVDLRHAVAVREGAERSLAFHKQKLDEAIQGEAAAIERMKAQLDRIGQAGQTFDDPVFEEAMQRITGLSDEDSGDNQASGALTQVLGL